MHELLQKFVKSANEIASKALTVQKMDKDLEFIPRSTRFNFNLTSPENIMERPKFHLEREASAALIDTTKKSLKQSIRRTAEWIIQEKVQERSKGLVKGLLDICKCLLHIC